MVIFGTFHFGIYILDQNDNFSCKNNQRVIITSPTGNASFRVSDTLVARWDSYGLCDSVLLQYRISTGTWNPCYAVLPTRTGAINSLADGLFHQQLPLGLIYYKSVTAEIIMRLIL